MTDNRGTELRVGQEVAYNISGQVAKGKIISLIGGGASIAVKMKIKVKLLHTAAGMPMGHVSTVTNERNVLVLQVATTCPHCGQNPVEGEF